MTDVGRWTERPHRWGQDPPNPASSWGGVRGGEGGLVKTKTCDLYCPEAELPVPDTCIVGGGAGAVRGRS